jgi:hypothetical protein
VEISGNWFVAHSSSAILKILKELNSERERLALSLHLAQLG